MSVNIVQNGELLPIAGKTVPAPTPDYVDEQFDSSKTYSKGMTCIEGNVRYRYKNSTATSGHRPPDSTYWEELSVSSQLSEGVETETLLNTVTVNANEFSAGGSTYKYAFKVDTSHETNISTYKKLKLVLWRNETSIVASNTVDLDEAYGIQTNPTVETGLAFSFTDGASYIDGNIWGRVDLNASPRRIPYFYILWYLRTVPSCKYVLKVYGIK